jgi:hypothetical protein
LCCLFVGFDFADCEQEDAAVHFHVHGLASDLQLTKVGERRISVVVSPTIVPVNFTSSQLKPRPGPASEKA